MHKKDYLQKQFEEFGKVLAEILKLKKRGDWDLFEKEIADAALKFTATEIQTAENCDEASFGQILNDSKMLSRDQKKILGALLFEKMNFYFSRQDPRGELLRSRCLRVYEHLKENQTSNEFDLDVHYKLEALNGTGLIS